MKFALLMALVMICFGPPALPFVVVASAIYYTVKRRKTDA